MNPADRTIRRFRRYLAMLLVLKYTLPLATVWGFIWGTAVLVLRAAAGVERAPLLWGLGGLIVCIAVAVLRMRRRLPSSTMVRALLDEQSGCGGMLMAAAECELARWRQQLPVLLPPHIRWDGRRAGTLLAIAAGFVLVSFAAPQGLADLASPSPLEIDREIARLVGQIALLRSESILAPERADMLRERLTTLREHASGKDPARTLEALDHLQGLAAKMAREAAEERTRRNERLTEAEALAEVLRTSADLLGPRLRKEALAELAGLLGTNGDDLAQLARQIDPKLLKAVQEMALDPEQLKRLAEALRDSKIDLGRQVEKMRKAGLIDAELLARCMKVGECDSEGLRAFLEQNRGKASLSDLRSYCKQGGQGGTNEGPGAAPLTWGKPGAKEQREFKEEVLPPGALTSLKGAPTNLPGERPAQIIVHDKSGGPASSGALREAAAGSGSANTDTLLPRHRAAVERYFERK
jgi:hypothetical protein